MFIWGGVNRLNKLNDCMSYNQNSKEWTTIVSQGSTEPNPRQGVCMVGYERNLFLIGGLTDNTFVNEVWKFDLGTYQYTLLDTGGIDAPPPGANYNCVYRDNKLIVLNGESFGTTPVSSIHEFDLKTLRW